jgi:hypothetical protein
MSARIRCLIAAALCICTAALVPAAAQADSPAWRLSLTSIPSSLSPGSKVEYFAIAVNVGAAPTSAPSVLEITLPAEIVPFQSLALNRDPSASAAPACSIASQTVTCETTEALHPGRLFSVQIRATVAGPEGTRLATATVSGGAAASLSASATTAVQPDPLPFAILPGFASTLINADGSPTALAGSHPYQQTVEFGFPIKKPDGVPVNSGRPRDFTVSLPRGMVGDPAATPRLCTEVEFIIATCPDPSQVGLTDVNTLLTTELLAVFVTPIYNMVPPPGTPAMLATNVAGVGIFAHVITGVRTDGDYGIDASLNDILDPSGSPIFNLQTQLWGDPSAQAHDSIRGNSNGDGGSCLEEVQIPACEVEKQKTAFLTAPSDCSGQPIATGLAADSWEEPGLFKHASYESADLGGNPISLSGCNALEYEPTIEAQPTTNLADSPSGLEFDLHQPQQAPHLEPLTGRATAELKDARVTLPAGMVVNPSQADGLGACSEAQAGYLPEKEGVHFSKAPQSCPDASKLGTLEITSPLLAQYTEGGAKLVTDPETGAPVPRPLKGAVYLAKPFENPFGSLLAIYLAVEDPQSGIVAKLAGRVEADPSTGQLTAVFEENPELPLEDVKLSLFGGARGSLISPPTCATHTTTSDLTPWSHMEGELEATPIAHPTDSFQTTAEPGGGACPTDEVIQSNAPSFSAGTLSPQAGAYSPFILKLSREDGSQRLTGIDTTLAPGLSGKLAGIAYCPEPDIAQAQSRSHPNEGITERESPSCPAASKVGAVNVGAGAGPTPFHTQGTAYLAGPYKGAPLSLVIITPAIAGPFDLGTVVVRTALYVDLGTAQIHAVSDPFPTILDGIPLDLRSVALRMDRPDFTLNPTSCDEMAILGNATSALGSIAPLSQRFQVGGCSSLGFKPSLKLSLKGPTKRSGNPALRAVLTYPKSGAYANIASAQVGFPPSEFIDQGNLDKVCVQADLKAGTCPVRSIYGHAKAWSPLLDKPLEGPVYLGVGYGHRLPDVVADLNGQIRVLLHGKVDTTPQDGIRNTFEVVPDAPVSRFEITLKGGEKYGLLENHENLCAHTQRASARFIGQNGKVAQLGPKIANDCKRGKGKKRGR